METGEAEFEKVVEITDKFIAHGNPAEVAFWLGYRHGIKHHLLGVGHAGPSEEHRCFIEVAEQGHYDKFIDAYSHGYRNGIDGRPCSDILGEWERMKVAKITKFQRMNGCSVCKRSKPRGDGGPFVAEPGGRFWCSHLNKGVDWKEGRTCPEWTCE